MISVWRSSVLLLTLPLLLAACQPSRPPPAKTITPHPETIPPSAPTSAIQLVRVDLGNAIGTDLRVLEPRLSFAPTDTIHAVIVTEGHDTTPHQLIAKWSHLDSRQTVLEESKTRVFRGAALLDFQISSPDGWPLGRYKVEFLLDGTLVQTRLFDVRPL